jgi:N-methylhydantoinase B/oxoprolinase/acetone carboxylase alpha subunit
MTRDPELVARDVFLGYVSREGAREWYGVVVDPATNKVDQRETGILRKDLLKRTFQNPEL